MLLRDVHPQDVSIEPFKTFKKFTFTNIDSGSGVFALKANSGSLHNFQTGSALSQSIGTYNALSESIGKPKSTWYSNGTFYNVPVYYMLNQTFYENYSGNSKLPQGRKKVEPFLSYGPSNPNKNFRHLNASASLINLPQQLIGEGIKPNSVRILDNISDVTTDIRDDGDGNLYDFNYSASYALHKDSSFKTFYSASVVGYDSSSVVLGNVFYKQGMIVMTSTGSKYLNAFTGDMSNGYTLSYRSTHTIYQHEYRVISPAGKHNSTVNPSATLGRSGSFSVGVGKTGDYTFFPPGDNPSGGFNSTGSFKSFYEATQHYENFVTHSEFRPYITTIGLYNDAGELLVVGRTSRPIKNDDKMAMSFVVRFDV
mgnify:FL=1